MKSSLIVFGVLFFMMGSMSFGQMADNAEVRELTEKYDMGLGKQPSFSLFNLSRLNLSHSYSLSFFSGAGISGSQGLYHGTLTYRLSKPLTLTLGLGILHDPGSLIGGDRSTHNSALFLPSGYLDWKPSDNFRMSIGFETVPAYGFGQYNLGRNSFWRH
ncbi:MAG: hypothetical protein V3V99_10640 [candidate division Zixibacteria bacterium]